MFHRMAVAESTDPAALVVPDSRRPYWPFLLAFVVVVAAGVTWLTLGLKVMAW